jgi:hypothetical protein
MSLRIFAMDALGGLCDSTLRWCDVCDALRSSRLGGETVVALGLAAKAINSRTISE